MTVPNKNLFKLQSDDNDNVFRLRVSRTRKVFNETNKAEEKYRNRKI